MSTRLVVFNGRKVVSFLSTNGTEHDYEVYDRDTNEVCRIHYVEGAMRGTGRDATADEQSAVLAYRAEQEREYQEWLKANPDLAQYA